MESEARQRVQAINSLSQPDNSSWPTGVPHNMGTTLSIKEEFC